MDFLETPHVFLCVLGPNSEIIGLTEITMGFRNIWMCSETLPPVGQTCFIFVLFSLQQFFFKLINSIFTTALYSQKSWENGMKSSYIPLIAIYSQLSLLHTYVVMHHIWHFAQRYMAYTRCQSCKIILEINNS